MPDVATESPCDHYSADRIMGAKCKRHACHICSVSSVMHVYSVIFLGNVVISSWFYKHLSDRSYFLVFELVLCGL
jgi:hypothetical protein